MSCPTCQQSGPDADQTRRARAALCKLCVYAEHEPGAHWLPAAMACTVSGKPVAEHVRSCAPSCPKGKHPGQDGRVRWGWMRWYGVPRFLRWALAGQLTGPLPGCGCHCWTKDRWNRLRARILRKQGVSHVAD